MLAARTYKHMGILRIRLGYDDDQPDPVLTSDRQTVVDDLMAKLDSIDSQLDAALPDSMAEAVGDLRVNYLKHVGLLRDSGSTLLRQLAKVSKLPLMYDSYRHIDYSTATISPHYVQNYW